MFTNLRKYAKLFFFRRKWRRLNAHNETSAFTMYPLNKVKVGKKSYGSLTVVSYCNESTGRLTIGDYVSISPGVTFVLDGNHYTGGFTTYPVKSKLHKRQLPLDAFSKGPIIVEDEVWIGTNALIMSGVTIGKGSVVAAGSVVVKDVEPFSIVGGNPAKFIKYRIAEELIPEVSKHKLADLSEADLSTKAELLYERPTQEVVKKIFGK